MDELKTIDVPEFGCGSYGLTVQVEPAGSGRIKSADFEQFHTEPKDYPYTSHNSRYFQVTAVPEKGRVFSHWQKSYIYAKADIRTMTTEAPAPLISVINDKTGRAINVFAVAFFKPVETHVEPGPTAAANTATTATETNSKPGKAELLAMVDELRQAIEQL
jgi:hypothetical protein